MSQKRNHHFVPQYHFRLFTDGKPYIHVASRDGSRVIHFASVKGQCARHKFYGNEWVENWLSKLESYHASVYRAIINIAWNAQTTVLSKEEGSHLREAILIQHSRTPRNARLHASLMDQMLLHTYWEYLKTLPITQARQSVLDAIEHGRVIVKNSQFNVLIQSLRVAQRAGAAISDLSLIILRNHTPTPFIMGDAPCIFSNHYMRTIQNSGVLGLMTSGLMIALPLDARTQILFYDAAVYKPDYSSIGCIDIFRVEDISILNALQIHAAEENVYFSDVSAESYVRRMLFAHPRIPVHRHAGFIVHGPGKLLFNGIPNTGEVLHTFEPQLPITLDLSFISTTPLPANVNPNRPRNPFLAQQIEKIFSLPDKASPIGMDEFIRWIESEIHISGDT